MSRISARRLVLALPLLAAFGMTPAAGAQTVFADGIDQPSGITQLADGRVLVAAFGGNTVEAFATDGTPLGTFASDVDDPTPIRQLADGRVLVGEFNEGVIRAFSAAGTDLGIFASGLDGPVDITQLADGKVLISENYTPSARAFSPSGEDLGPYVTSVTDSGAAFGTAQLADGRIVLTVSGPFEAVQLFSAGGGFLDVFAMGGDTGLSSVKSVRQLTDGRIAVLDYIVGEVEGYSTTGAPLGVIATLPSNVADFVQLADGRLLVTQPDDRVYEVAVTTDGEAGADARATHLDISPNPTRGAATLRYIVAEAGRVTVTVHDMLGRRVAVVHDGPLAAGTTALPLDAAGLAPGIYVVRMTTSGVSAVERLTVVH